MADGDEVVWITDGDTIDVRTDVSEVTIRLAGINAPDKGECYAEESTDHLIDSLKFATVTLEILDTDQFGRTLAHVFAGNRHVNLELVEKGLAIANGVTDDPYGDELIAAENQAYGAGAGLWGGTACGFTGAIPDVEFEAGISVTNPPGPDDQELNEEKVVIVNTSNSEVALDGWILRDESTRHRYSFHGGLDPGDRFAVTSNDSGWDPGDSPVWNNDGDMALLQLPDGTVVDRWRY